jgi:SLOG cluster2
LAYGGSWEEREDNFTYELLRLISAEQEDNSLGGPDTNLQIGKLYNHSSWPYYLDITPRIEAQWINCCQIVRVTQQQAGFAEADIVPDADAKNKQPKTIFNAAVTLSAMRHLQMQPTTITIPDVQKVETVPAVVARVLLGGNVARYAGFMPGLFEEALVTLQERRPLYVLGGFGGAAEVLADAMLAPGGERPQELTLDWHKARNGDLAKLLESAGGFAHPQDFRSSEQLFDELFDLVKQARANLSSTLNTGLSDEDTRELLKTRDMPNVVHLVRTGLTANRKWQSLPA